MAVNLPDARTLSDEVLEALRLRALGGCELGFTEADVADLLGVCRETVCQWWTAYCRGGVPALPQQRSGRPLGSGRLLSDEQARQVQVGDVATVSRALAPLPDDFPGDHAEQLVAMFQL